MPESRKDIAYLILEDGLVFEGRWFGKRIESKGEVVFTTAMNGYVESLSDPSYAGQILTITHPLIGNYGIPKIIKENGIIKNFESDRIQVSGLVLNEITNGSEWNAERSLEAWLEDEGIAGIAGIDTRELTLHIRNYGSMAGAISKDDKLNKFEKYDRINFIDKVSAKKAAYYENKGPTVAVIDYGLKEGILDCIYSMGYSIARLPYNTDENELLSYDPIGVVISNGPGNPNLLENETEFVSKILERKIPTLGICLGHQLIGKALGMEIRKMKFGHRAINKGVIDLRDGSCMITTHNHGYAIQGEAPKGVRVSHMSLDDRTIEGIVVDKANAIGVQFHPEARPGANDGLRVFREFENMLKRETHGKKTA